MKKRIAAFALSVLILISALPFNAFASSTGAVVVVENCTAAQGGYAYVNLNAKNFVNVAVLDIEVHYDSSVMRVHYANNSTLFNGASVSVNTATAGVIKISAMSVSGFNCTSSTMMKLCFAIDADCPVGDYPIKVAVGDAYDGDMMPAAISSENGVVTVKAAAAEKFSLGVVKSSSTLEYGETLTISVKNSASKSFASADFYIEYDREQFNFEEIELTSTLQNEGAVYSVNSSIEGLVVLSYASTNAVSAYNLFTVKLKVIANTDATAKILVKASNVYNNDLIAYSSSSITTSVNLVKAEVIPDYKNLSLSSEKLFIDKEFNSTLTLEAGATVAAADFVVNYDTDVFSCSNVTVDDAVSVVGAIVVVNQNYTSGEIRFSYINQAGVNTDSLDLINITLIPKSTPQTHSSITVSGADVCDINFNDVTLEYIGVSGCIFDCEIVEPTCTEIGYTIYECGCGEYYIVDEVSVLGHDEITHKAQMETCTEIGWQEYVTCSRCDYTTYEEIAALGHDIIPHEAKAPTCTAIGWDAYDTCSRCDYTTYKELAAIGHRALTNGQIWVDSVEIKNDASYPFVLKDGVYSSTNKQHYTDSTFAITALYDCELELKYSVSSEQNYDKLIIKHNGVQLFSISGLVDWATQTITLSAGDVVTINYHKDGSVNVNADTGYFSYLCNQTLIDGIVEKSADECVPSCTEAVVCHYCGTVVKTELGHDLVYYDAKAPTCTEIGWEAYDTCSRCNYTTYVEKSALGHDIIDHEAKEPTCTAIGWDAYDTCSRCDYTTFVPKDANGHSSTLAVEENILKPTCLEKGSYEKVVYCSVCGEELSRETVIVDALGHTETLPFTENMIEPTCKSGGSYDNVIYCSVCGEELSRETVIVDALGHTETLPFTENMIEPTCKSGGSYDNVIYCSVCSKEILREKVTLEATVHSVFVEGETWIDSVECLQEPENAFILGEDGIYRDNNQVEEEYIGFGIKAIYDCKLYLRYMVSGVYEQSGMVIYLLSNGQLQDVDLITGEVDWKTLVFDLKADDVVVVYYIEAESANSYENTCCFSFACTSTYTTGLVPKPAAEFEPTCTDAVVCDYCGEAVKSALGHDAINHGVKEPTCTEIGWDAYETCSRCDYTTYMEKAALGHNVINHDAKAPTCTEIGWYQYDTCARCDYTTYVELAALGHRIPIIESKWLDSVECLQEPENAFVLGEDGIYSSTDETNGTEVGFGIFALYDCTVELKYSLSSANDSNGLIIYRIFDSDTETIEYTYGAIDWKTVTVDLAAGDAIVIYRVGNSANGDKCYFSFTATKTFWEGEVQKSTDEFEPTCTDAVVCHYCDKVVKAALGHSYDNNCDDSCNTCGELREKPHLYGEWVITKKSSCIEQGSKHKICNGCGEEVIESIAILGHSIVKNNAKTPTCTEIGWDAYDTCSRCDYTTYEEIAALGHDIIPHEAKAPTCTAIGWDAYDTCSRCDYTTYVEKSVLGHDEITHKAQMETCTEIGWQEYVTCSRCDYTTYVEKSALGHRYDNACDTSCNACGTTRSITHIYGNWITTKQPTCVEMGSKYKKCGVCGDIVTESIDATGVHDYESAVTNPTCTKQGYTTHTCSMCNDSYVDSYTDAKGHNYDNACDTICNTCSATRVTEHKYTDKFDESCNICGEIREISAWQITPSATGVYNIAPSKTLSGFTKDSITVYDKQENVVKYNDSKNGWPLVKGQTYTIKLNKEFSNTSNLSWNLTQKFDSIFPDASANQWYSDAITYSVGRGLISGYGSTGLFGTADNIQRQDFLVILARLDGVDLTKYTNKNCPFPDVAKGSYYEAAVMWGVENGITTGYQNGKFGVGDKITREQLVTFLYRYANYKGLDTSYTTAEKNKVKNSYSDFKNVTGYAVDPIIWGISNGVISGKENGKYIAPGGNALRCEVAQIMYNIYLNNLF